MHNLERINVEQFYSLEEDQAAEYLVLSKMLKPKPLFCNTEARNINSLQYGEVSLIKSAIVNPSWSSLVKAFEIVFGVSEYKQRRAEIVDYFYALRWLTRKVEEIIERENKYLSATPDPLLEMAGVEQLSRFHELPALKMLGMQYGKPPQEVETWPYSLVFSLLYMDVVETEVRNRYQELKTKQNNVKK